jgi:hypothetical protein
MQQIEIAWKVWKEALEYLAPDGDIGDPVTLMIRWENGNLIIIRLWNGILMRIVAHCITT